MRRHGLIFRGLTNAQKNWHFISGRFHHFLDFIGRITAEGDDRIDAEGNDRITADSKY